MFLQDKRILITGVCGTVGKALCQRINSGKFGKPAELIGIDNNESELFFCEQEFGSKNASFFLRDLRDFQGLRTVMDNVDYVFHTAALKHVGLCEMSPYEAVNTNIVGLQNLVNAAIEANIEKFIFTSSDKAVNPTNVMGTSKLMGERLVTAANNSRCNKGTIFASTRFGNVLGSRGSVVPIFREQILNGKDITLTSKEMTRFIMTIEEAADLVLSSGEQALGGEVFITKMPVASIYDLAEVMNEHISEVNGVDKVNLTEIGVKPGEKLYEELMSDEEMARSLELDDYFVVLPAFRNLYEINYSYSNVVSETVTNPYKSSVEPKLSLHELKEYLVSKGII